MVWIDTLDSTPIYEQIVNQYKNLIARGVLAPNEKMPSVRSLAAELSINPNTIQKVYTELERQGYLYTVSGRGAFVHGRTDLKEEKQKEVLSQLQKVMREAKDSGIELDVLVNYLTEHME